MGFDNSTQVAQAALEGRLEFTIVFAITSVLGVILNSFTIAIIALGKSTSKESAFQILNLAIADLLSAFLYPPIVLVVQFHYKFNASSSACKFLLLLDTSVFYASLLWNVAISMEKFVAVYFPLRMLVYRQKEKVIVAVIVWLLAGVSQLDVLLYGTVIPGDEHSVPYCTIANPLKKDNIQLYDAIIGLRFVIPAVIIVSMYGLIALGIFRRKRIGDEPWRQNCRANNEKMKVMRMLSIDAFVTLLTWIVTLIPMIMSNRFRERVGSQHLRVAELVLTAIYISNCYTTPIIYYMFNNSFKKDTDALIKRMLPCAIKKRSQPSTSRTEYTFVSTRSGSMTIVGNRHSKAEHLL